MSTPLSLYVYVAEPNSCKKCRANHGKIYDHYENVSQHPNCKCCLNPLPTGITRAQAEAVGAKMRQGVDVSVALAELPKVAINPIPTPAPEAKLEPVSVMPVQVEKEPLFSPKISATEEHIARSLGLPAEQLAAVKARKEAEKPPLQEQKTALEKMMIGLYVPAAQREKIRKEQAAKEAQINKLKEELRQVEEELKQRHGVYNNAMDNKRYAEKKLEAVEAERDKEIEKAQAVFWDTEREKQWAGGMIGGALDALHPGTPQEKAMTFSDMAMKDAMKLKGTKPPRGAGTLGLLTALPSAVKGGRQAVEQWKREIDSRIRAEYAPYIARLKEEVAITKESFDRDFKVMSEGENNRKDLIKKLKELGWDYYNFSSVVK